ncbi:MAG TPA: SUMF1/EgtB/PvdO family nonheme iron enzyme [Longimicrobium sp.]|nr:SUMF1/EgtB/PvdO family nonheme iron enzyme [Longimicrobium sp.]
MPASIKVLFLASDLGTEIRPDREARTIMQQIRAAARGDRVTFETEWAVRPGDLQPALLRHRPQVLHFSGHADPEAGILLEDEEGKPWPVNGETLRGVFAAMSHAPRVVVLNACDSLPTVSALSGGVDYCIGMENPITDEAATVFAAAFYGALAEGEGVEQAFAAGKSELDIQGIPETRTPVLHVRPGAPPVPPWPESVAERVEEIHYLQTLAAKYGTLHLYGGGGAGADAVRINDLFTPPNLKLTRAPSESIASALKSEAGRAPAAPAAPGQPRRIRVQAVQALAEVPRLVVVGEPGGGKSVLSCHVAAVLARRRCGETGVFLPGWKEGGTPLPVIILLRELAAWLAGRAGAATPAAGWVWEYLEHLLESWGCADALPTVRDAIRAGDAAVFMDGLDEVPETAECPRRTQVARAIQAFAAPLAGTRLVVTCRTHAYEPRDPWRLPETGFPSVELDRFNLGHIREFVRRWYQAEGAREGWADEESARRAELLFDQIEPAPHLRALAESPLLLTLMARIHRHDHALPDDRAQLYDRSIDLLLAEWENRKEDGWEDAKPGVVARLRVPTAELRTALAELAYGAHQAAARAGGGEPGVVAIGKLALLERLRSLAGDLNRAEEFIGYIAARAGLLVPRDDGTYAFPHRTFQEFLAATHLLRHDGFADTLVKLVQGDFTWWREVFSLAAALLATRLDGLAALADAVLAEADDAPPAEALVHAAAPVALAMAAGPFLGQAHEIKRHARLAARMRSFLGAAMDDASRLPAAVRAAAAFARGRIGDPRNEVRSVEAMAFRHVPAGPFWMGSPAGDPDTYEEEVPVHQVNVAYDFWIGRFPVTVAQLRAFTEATGVPSPPDPRVTDAHPASATWRQAMAFCEWMTERLRALAPSHPGPSNLPDADRSFWSGVAEGRLAVALPSEAEWEKAARGVDGCPRFPWGDTATPERANYNDTAVGGPSVVGCFPDGASPFGMEDAAGNVWEWTRSLWGTNDQNAGFRYPYDPGDGREDLDAPADVLRVLRGGCYHNPVRVIRTASRIGAAPHVSVPNMGFRVAVVPLTAFRQESSPPAGTPA